MCSTSSLTSCPALQDCPLPPIEICQEIYCKIDYMLSFKCFLSSTEKLNISALPTVHLHTFRLVCSRNHSIGDLKILELMIVGFNQLEKNDSQIAIKNYLKILFNLEVKEQKKNSLYFRLYKQLVLCSEHFVQLCFVIVVINL